MSQIFAEQNSQHIVIPHGWQPPKFQLGQLISFRVWLIGDQYEMEFGIISGMTWRGVNTHSSFGIDQRWEYTIAINPDSPGWRVYAGSAIAEEDDIFHPGVADSAHTQLMKNASKRCEMVLK